jgi:hypothetical protein
MQNQYQFLNSRKWGKKIAAKRGKKDQKNKGSEKIPQSDYFLDTLRLSMNQFFGWFYPIIF